MRFTVKSTDGPIAVGLRLFAVAVIYTISADAAAGGYSITDQSQVAPTTVVIGADNPSVDVPNVQLVNCMIGIKTESVVGPRDGVLIHQNSISQDGLLGSGQSCIVASWLNASLIRANRFEGDYTEPLVALLSSSNNVLLENRDLRSTELPEPPTYFLDVSSSGNLIRGASGTAQDLGTNNQIFLQGPGGK